MIVLKQRITNLNLYYLFLNKDTNIYNHILDFINKTKLLYNYQFGFGQITLVDRITKALDNGDMMIGVFLDFKKAFDCVDHKILLRKLYAYGILLHERFVSYME